MKPPGFRSTFRSLAKLMIRANDLRDDAAKSGDRLRLCQQIDPVLHELETVRPALEGTLSAFGTVPASRGKPSSPRGSSRIAATLERLIAECEACGRRFCELLRRARKAGDALKARVAYSILRLLEKLLWVLLPQMEAVRLQQPLA
jgi:hypothetical protein